MKSDISYNQSISLHPIAAALLIAFFLIFINGCDSPIEPKESIDPNLEIAVGEQMVVTAKITAHMVAIAEKAGLTTEQINSHLKAITDNTVLSEFWITDETGHAYLTNTGINFSFSPDPKVQPQAYVFWDLITGKKNVIVQTAQKRELDDQIYKYVGVAGIDKRRIVQVGLNAEKLKTDKDIEDAVGDLMVVEASVAAHLVAIAEAAGLISKEINNHLKEIASGTVLDEFWITDSDGHAYLRNVDVDFNFSPDSTIQPQAYVFWELLTGAKQIIIQKAQKRELDDQIFKYAGVAGIDKPRIVQVGIHYSYFE
ncbi:MAG: hypothetical protein V1720_17190 [bacterium]